MTIFSGEQSSLNKKISAVTLLVLMSLALALTPAAIVFGQSKSTSRTVQIIEVAPLSELSVDLESGISQYNGTVGEAFNIQGTLYTSDGSYQVLFGQSVVATGVSVGYYVNANFTVPTFAGGSYSLFIRDIAININSTGYTPESFLVLTGYFVTPVPTLVQEGSSVALTVTVNGGTPKTVYDANVSVVLPSPLDTVYSAMVSLGTSNQAGVASTQVTYPSSSFLPTGNTTDYVGSYTVYFNQTSSLGQSQFYVSFLNSTTYHRGDTVTVGAVGYQPARLSLKHH